MNTLLPALTKLLQPYIFFDPPLGVVGDLIGDPACHHKTRECGCCYDHDTCTYEEAFRARWYGVGRAGREIEWAEYPVEVMSAREGVEA